MGGPLTKTKDGIEKGFATNHIGHFLLTNKLMALLLKSDEPRIINVSSLGHMSGTGDYSDYNFEKTAYSWHAAYGQSKLARRILQLANIHFTYALAKKLAPRGVTSLAVHPGTIYATNIFATLEPQEDAELRGFITATGSKLKSLEEGTATTIFAALDPNLREHNGAYLADCQVSETTGPGAKVPDAPENLWKLSETLVGETFAY
ncbi:NAD(P)-binding protein [Auricularia subglabra TFB-10046 SS5]|nr:NAD(P)-binding protein [Auricularia subglabra TFB-10046 SS5]